MLSDRYVKIVLTVIAIELGWLGVKDVAVPVSAQQTQQAQQAPQNQQLTPVVIRGIDLPCQGNLINCRETSLPVSLTRTNAPVRVTADTPLPVDARGTVRIRQDQAFIVETGDRALLVQSVPPTAAPRPGIP
jgi:Flp pilus assembly protein CpaB